MLNSRISQREIARRLQVDQATVSRALSDSPLLSPETKSRILEEARKLGYQPDPVLASLNTYRQTRRPIFTGRTLAWIGYHEEGALTGYQLGLLQAAQARAEEHGFLLNYLYVNQKMESKRVDKILLSRGVAGLIFGPQERPHSRIKINIDSFSVVAVGRTVFWPPVDLVSVDHFQTILTCYRNLHKLGYRRIALVLPRTINERAGGRWVAGFLYEQSEKRVHPTIPPFVSNEFIPQDFSKWFRRNKPDALIFHDIWKGSYCREYLQHFSPEIPTDIGIALLSLTEKRPVPYDFTGIQEPDTSLAIRAIDVLVSHIRNNHRGLPAERCTHLLAGKWVEGSTTRNRIIP